MKNWVTGLLLTGLSFSLLPAQVQRCVTMERDAVSRAENPYRGTLDDFETWMQTKLATSPVGSSAKVAGAVRTIPVVVHVIYSNAAENISTAQVQSQIDVLNEDFRRLNADAINTRSVFLPAAADCDIEFCLAQRTPSGAPTDGIDRVSWPGSPFSDAYVDGTIKPATSWDPTQYFNIWVCNLSGGLLGWAQFPDASGLSGMPASGGAANTDGVVLLHESVGRPPANPFPGPYNLGRTATHEVGHWLGLRHVWGDGGCSVHDFCADTPDAAGANFGCPLTANSCTETPSFPDMVENYMDYTDDDCMNIFTNDQKSRMNVVLALSPRRASLLTSLACTPSNTVIADFDYTPSSGCAPLTVNYTSTSSGVVTSYNWSFPGGTPSTSTLANPTVVYSAAGTYSATLIVTGPVNSDTLALTGIITASTASAGVPLPVTQDFESATWPPSGWSIDNPDAGITWQQWTVGGITPGTKAARVNCFSYTSSGQRDGLISPAMDLNGYSTVTMDFDHAYRRRTGSGSNSDSLIVYVSVCNGPWERVRSLGEAGSATLATNTSTNTNWAPSTTAHWCGGSYAPCNTIDLTPYAGNQNVRVKFEVWNRNNNNLYIDNVNITGAILPPVAGFSAADPSICAGGTVNFTNSTSGPSVTYNWTFTGGSPSSSTAVNPSVVYNTPGTYTVSLVATNAAGSDTETLTSYVTVYPNPAVAPNGTNATCGLSNGTAAANATGGSPSYTYLWSTGATTSTLSGLGAGTYSVTVTDANGCTSSGSVSLTAASAPSASISGSTPAVCTANGTATVAGSGGTPGYTYLWSNGQTTATATSLAGGTYTVTVTDAAGCTATTSVTITSSGGATLTLGTVDPENCGLANGTATVNATGGTPGYTYLWSDGQTTATATGLTAGTYTVTVTDGSGCVTTTTATVGSVSGPSASASGTDVSCANANDGTATASASGGTAGYTYLWSTGATTSTASGLAPGTYTVTVTDAAGCTSVASVTVTEPAPLTGSVSSTSETSPGAADGTATVAPTGGTPGYTYVWSTVPTQTTSTATGLTGGSYTVTVTDANGCSWTDTVLVSTLVSVNELLAGESLSLYPNPAEEEVTLSFSLHIGQPLHLRITNALGQELLARDLGSLGEGSVKLPVGSFAEGIYFVELATTQRRWVEKLVVRH
jgi:PKD repeat protein